MAISRAISTGERKGVTNTLGPNFSRVVRAAMAAMAVMGSGIGSGEDGRSENHSESISLFSQSSTKRQKKSRPAGPAGHGPGMTPTRYLVRMARTLPRRRLLRTRPRGRRTRTRPQEGGDHRGGQGGPDDRERPHDRERPAQGVVEP